MIDRLFSLRGKAAVRLGPGVDIAIQALILKGRLFRQLVDQWFQLRLAERGSVSEPAVTTEHADMVGTLFFNPAGSILDEFEERHLYETEPVRDPFNEQLDANFEQLMTVLRPYLHGG